MLAKKERLSRETFNRSFSLGKRLHGTTLQLVYSKSETLHGAVVIPKKIEPRAVMRNKLRRRVYDALRQVAKEEGVIGTFIFIFKAKSSARAFTDLKQEVSELVHTVTKQR